MSVPRCAVGEKQIINFLPNVKVGVLHCLEVVPLAFFINDIEIVFANFNIGYVSGLGNGILTRRDVESQQRIRGGQILNEITRGHGGSGVELSQAEHALEGYRLGIRELVSYDSYRKGSCGKRGYGHSTPDGTIIINLKLYVIEPCKIQTELLISDEPPKLHPEPDIFNSTGRFCERVGHWTAMLHPVLTEEVLPGDMPAVVITVDYKANMLDGIKNVQVDTGSRAVSKADTNIKG